MLWVVVLLPLYCALDAAQVIRVLPSVICVRKYRAEKYKQVEEAVLKARKQKQVPVFLIQPPLICPFSAIENFLQEVIESIAPNAQAERFQRDHIGRGNIA